jgi:hypothetical protein
LTNQPEETVAPLEPAEDFDLDAWLSDAKRPERSVTVYKRADLLADLDELERRIEDLQRIPEEDQSLSDNPAALEAEYLAKAQEFHASGLLISVKGLTKDELDALAAESKAANESAADAGRRVVAAALVSPKLTFEQLGKLEKAIGSVQMGMISTASNLATMKAPEVTVPFSRKSSGPGSGQG